MYNTGGGNVGIGTNDTKEYKLAVNGNAVFTSVNVKTYNNWPDYVFSPSYGLTPLSQVEKFIKQYIRLPEMPSAEEAKKNGLKLEENQALLLKKVEELTLYVIEQNKKQEDLNQKLKLQAGQIEELQLKLEKSKKHKTTRKPRAAANPVISVR